MIFTSGIISGASGSIGGLTASRNKGGPYFRMRAIPVNPSTGPQVAVRLAMADLSNAWVTTLTQLQRDGWDQYALNVPLVNALGQARTVTGLNQFVRSNTPRLQVGLAQVDDAPVIFTIGGFTPVSIVVSNAAQTVATSFEVTDDWVEEDGSAMLIQGSRLQNESINFFKGPYQSIPPILGAVIPETSPVVQAVPFPVSSLQKYFGRYRVTRADGRLSAPQLIGKIVSV